MLCPARGGLRFGAEPREGGKKSTVLKKTAQKLACFMDTEGRLGVITRLNRPCGEPDRGVDVEIRPRGSFFRATFQGTRQVVRFRARRLRRGDLRRRGYRLRGVNMTSRITKTVALAALMAGASGAAYATEGWRRGTPGRQHG